MSSPALQPRLPRRAGNAVARARLTPVPRRRARAPRVPFLALVSVLLVGGVVGLLLFNTSMQQASFAATNLEDEAAALTARQQVLEMQVDQLRDPQRVAEAAQALGMVIPASTAFIRPDGSVVGSATPAAAQPFRIRPLPARKPRMLDPRPVVVPARAGDPEARGEQARQARGARQARQTSRQAGGGTGRGGDRDGSAGRPASQRGNTADAG